MLVFLIVMNLAAAMAVGAGIVAGAAFGRDVGIGAGIFTLVFLHTALAIGFFGTQAPPPVEEAR